MWQASYTTQVQASAQVLFNTMADINHWHAWATDLDYARIEGIAHAGAPFVLKPRGGPKVKLLIETFEPFSTFTDLAILPLAKMRTRKTFVQSGNETCITMTVEIWGILGFLWQRVIGREQIAGAPAQMAAMVAYALKEKT